MSDTLLFIKRIGLVGVTYIVNLLIGIILIPVFTKGQPLEYYGVWVQINVSMSLVPALTCLGLPYTLVRYLPGETDTEKVSDSFYSILALVFLLNLMVSPVIAYLIIRYAAGNMVSLTPLFAAILLVQAVYSVGIAYLRAMQRVKVYSVLMIIQNLLVAMGVSGAVIYGYGIMGALVVLLAVNLMITLIILYEVISDIGVDFPSFASIREHLAFGLPTVFGNFSDWIVSSSDRYLIGYLLGVIYVGYYNPAYSVASLINVFLWPLIFLLPPRLSELYEQGDRERINSYFKYSLKYYLLLAIPSIFGLSALSGPILTIISTPEIAENALTIVPLVGAGVVVYGVYAIISQVFVLERKTSFIARLWIVAATVNFILNLLAIPYLGITGAALTTLVAYLIALSITAGYALKFFRIPLRLADILKSTLSSAVMYLLISYMNPSGALELIMSVFLGAAVYVILISLLKTFKGEEIEALRSLLGT